jgi:hypothetical protein
MFFDKGWVEKSSTSLAIPPTAYKIEELNDLSL